jgi:hypothetical protein
MKTLTLIICGFFLTAFHSNANAVESTVSGETRIMRIEPSLSPTEASLIYLEDGRLLRIDPANQASLAKLKQIAQSGDVIRFKAARFGRYHLFTEVKVVPSSSESSFESLQNRSFDMNQFQDYSATDLQTLENTTEIFKSLTSNMRRRSQCYQRAENWVYEMWKSNRIYSTKTFMFFTRKFIREHRYDWWFHVTPQVQVAGIDYMMDRTFTDAPLTRQDWTAEFMPKDVVCPLVAKYSDYRDHQEDQLCYHIQVPMYYYQPRDIENLEKGQFVTDFVASELANARRAYR